MPKYANLLFNHPLFYVCGEECVCISSSDGINVTRTPQMDLFSAQEEVDTRIILHLHHASNDIKEDVSLIIRSPYTDVLIILIHFVNAVQQPFLFDRGTGNKRRLINVKALLNEHGPELCQVLLSFHAFSSCDTTSAFAKQGKLKPLKILEKQTLSTRTLKRLGQAVQLDEETERDLERFVCCMYQKRNYNNVNKLRADMFKQKFKPKNDQPLSSCTSIEVVLEQ